MCRWRISAPGPPTAEIAGFIRAVGKVARELGLVPRAAIASWPIRGRDSHQEVPHLHIHIFGGQRLGRMIQPLPG